MKKIVITTDSIADLPLEYLKNNSVVCIPLSYTLGEKVYDDLEVPFLSPTEFYKRVKEGDLPKTSQINKEVAKKFWKELIDKGYDILHISCSSGISGSISTAIKTKDEILKENKDAKIEVVDSICASLGVGLLVHYLVKARDGLNVKELASFAEYLKQKIAHYFTVDDLKHLARGGRISKASAGIATVLNIKPVLWVNKEGRLEPISKTMGRKKAIKKLLDYMVEECDESFKDVFISHGDCLEDAEYLKKLINEKYKGINFKVNFIGPIVGTHSGQGTLALFFVKKDFRNEGIKENKTYEELLQKIASVKLEDMKIENNFLK